MTSVVERLLRYVKINTRSDLESTTSPSTMVQFALAKLLVEEMKSLGIQQVELDDKCYVYGVIPSNIKKSVPTIGLIAHMDTSYEISGENVNPRIIENYDGNPIVLNQDANTILSPEEFPELLKYVGQILITTDGTTLLGADDKAGVAIIMTVAETILKNPAFEHGTIKICFTPDEEVGRGTESFDVKKFNADFAYTIDGGEIGELEFECFNAAMAKVNIQGRSVHPGSAKDQMINAIELGIQLHKMLPAAQKPEYTQGYEGFFHLMEFKADVEEARLMYIIRDHDLKKFELKKNILTDAIKFVNDSIGSERITCEMVEQYRNMKEVIMPSIHVINTARAAMEQCGITPKIGPIRGGTDGARLSYMGLPTPNIFTGGHNYHGRYEYIPPASMEKSVEVLLKILDLYANNPQGVV